jgi:hypothetical protein
MFVQKIFYERNNLQKRLLAASCYIPDNVDDDDCKKTREQNKQYDNSRIYCLYCRNKFNTNSLGLGIPRLTKGCKRGDNKIGSRTHTTQLRRWRKDDSHSNLKGISVGIEETYGCISCCLCTVCTDNFDLIEAQISNKKSKHASVHLLEEEHMERRSAYGELRCLQ